MKNYLVKKENKYKMLLYLKFNNCGIIILTEKDFSFEINREVFQGLSLFVIKIKLKRKENRQC